MTIEPCNEIKQYLKIVKKIAKDLSNYYKETSDVEIKKVLDLTIYLLNKLKQDVSFFCS